MDEQDKSCGICQMNWTVSEATMNLKAKPEARNAVYRLTLQLLRLSCDDEDGDQSRLAEALGYDDAELMAADVDLLAPLVIQMQQAFGEDFVPCKEFMPESNKPIPAWLERERDKWRRFELTATDKAQVDELNDILTRHDLTRRELAVILACLRVRPEFSLADFHT